MIHGDSYRFILIHILLQECIATIPPIPYRDSEIDVDSFNMIRDMDHVMFGRPELIFKVKLKAYNDVESHTHEIPLIFFSALERVQLDPADEMHRLGDIIQLYEPGPLPALEPIMHVGFLCHVLCRAPLMPCYMGGSDYPTIPHHFARSARVRHGRADRQKGSGDGSKLYEVNMWMWKFGRGHPRPRGVYEAERIRSAFASASRAKQHESRKRTRDLE